MNACITNLSCASVALSGHHMLTGNGILYFNSNTYLATTYAGARLVPWPGSAIVIESMMIQTYIFLQMIHCMYMHLQHVL